MSGGSAVTVLRHNRVELALHHLRDSTGDGRPLLILHGLGERAPRDVPAWAEPWPGPVAALDFTGHGESTVPRGGGYTAELLHGDADLALAALDDGDAGITVVGRGLGAYVALQLAGARAERIRGTVLVDGPGLAGGPTGPTSQSFFSLESDGSAPDPYALVELGRDLRPPDYATSFARLALAASELDEPIAVACIFKPEWLEAVLNEPGVDETTLAEALERFGAV